MSARAVPARRRDGDAVPPDDVCSLDPGAALAALGGSRRSLAEDEVQSRRVVSDHNMLPPVGAKIAAQSTAMFAVILVVAAGLTFLTKQRSTRACGRRG